MSSDYYGHVAGEIADAGEPEQDWPCCKRAVYDDSIGWWCPEHGDQP